MREKTVSAKRKAYIGLMRALMAAASVLTCALVLFLIIYVLCKGLPNISWELLSTKPSYLSDTIGILPDIMNTIYIVITTIAIVLPLGVGRAIGEAMAVMMVSGNVANMPSLFQSVRFLTTAVASEMSYAGQGLHRQALFSVALVLFLFIMLINAALNFFLKRKDKA